MYNHRWSLGSKALPSWTPYPAYWFNIYIHFAFRYRCCTDTVMYDQITRFCSCNTARILARISVCFVSSTFTSRRISLIASSNFFVRDSCKPRPGSKGARRRRRLRAGGRFDGKDLARVGVLVNEPPKCLGVCHVLSITVKLMKYA